MTSCAICNNGLTPEKEITCDMCRNYIHTTCSGLSRTELQYLKNKDRKLSFHCPTCSDLKLQLVKLHELASTVGALESELRTLKESMTSRDVEIDPIKVPDVECIIQVSDRQRRKNNIILYNVSENVLNNRNDQVAADMELVGELLQMLDVSVDNLRTIRLGKFDSSRTDMKRPIKSWADFKYALKRKSAAIKFDLNGTGGGPLYSKHLTQLELRFLSVLGSSFAEGVEIPERGDEIQNLKSKLELFTKKPKEFSDVDTLDTENIICELAQRQERKNNLIIFNLPEMDSGSKTEQISEDTRAIKEMFSTLNIKVDTISPIRLGKYDPTSSARRRPVRIRLPHTDAVADVIRLSGKLKSIDKFKLVSLSRDKTPAQIGYYKHIKQQLTDRTLAGETGLSIKYIHGVPKVVQARNYSGN
ncbi:hypothetical protein Trydic_g15971 [Trypoxylus dichotomus]